MQQENLFHEDIFDAIRTAVQALGGAKKVGAELWPEKPVTKASELLNNCLNTTRPEKFDLEQFIWIMREAGKIGAHSIPNFIGQECNYKFEPINPEDETAKLMREFNQQVEAVQKIAKRLESLKS